VSAGNHAIATAYGAQVLGTSAKVVMPKTANPLRVKLATDLGAEIELAESPFEAFRRVREIEADEGRTFVHPFDGPLIMQGAGTTGLEITQQVEELDAMIVPIGGGGLCGSMAAAMKQVWPNIKIYGVEPEGANSTFLSLQAGKPVPLQSISTIADSLAPPNTEPYAFSVCQRFVDEVVLISDLQMRQAMGHLFYGMKLAVEPAGAASTAALLGPLKERLQGQRVGIIVCGANIDVDSFYKLIRLDDDPTPT
jgi:threonine dehydratase